MGNGVNTLSPKMHSGESRLPRLVAVRCARQAALDIGFEPT